MKTQNNRHANLSKIFILLLFSIILTHVVALDFAKLLANWRNAGGTQNTFDEWTQLMRNHDSSSADQKLQLVNEFINRKITFASDQEIWGQSDYWATPFESLIKGRGDCEDYVIAKYFTLRSMNIPDNQLRLIYVKARIGGPQSSIQQAHMVLAYYPNADSEPLILDSLISFILPASRRLDLSPVFSFNTQGVFAGAAANSVLGQGGSARLSRWQDLLDRARRDGFE